MGVDVGGANLKFASLDGDAVCTRFPMWRNPDRLGDALAKDLGQLHDASSNIDALAVTMTGELADCFADRSVGVAHIVAQMSWAAARLGIDELAFYGVDRQFRDSADATQHADLVAAANWHALASFVAEEVAGRAILVDIGSTTTDIIPIFQGRVDTSATTDYERLVDGSLVYVGCRRTPVCALVDHLNYRGRVSSVMNELFATIDDACLLLDTAEQDPECLDPENCDTADGRPRTKEFAANRLARMIGLDRRTVTISEAKELASQVVAAANRRISEAVGVLHPDSVIIISGHGHDLIDLPSRNTVVQLSDMLGAAVTRCAPAYAVASLYHSEASGVAVLSEVGAMAHRVHRTRQQ